MNARTYTDVYTNVWLVFILCHSHSHVRAFRKQSRELPDINRIYKYYSYILFLSILTWSVDPKKKKKKSDLQTPARDLAHLFLDPTFAQKTRGGLAFAKKWPLVPTNRRFSRRAVRELCPYEVPRYFRDEHASCDPRHVTMRSYLGTIM